MKKLNLRLVVCLSVATLLAGASVHFLHGFQVRRNASALLSQADRAEQDRKLDQAINYLQTYLGFVPGDNDARARYGLLLRESALRSKNLRLMQRVFNLLEQVLRESPERSDVRRRLVDTAMDLDRFTDAEVHLKRLLEAAPKDIELLELSARCQADNKEAAKRYA